MVILCYCSNISDTVLTVCGHHIIILYTLTRCGGWLVIVVLSHYRLMSRLMSVVVGNMVVWLLWFVLHILGVLYDCTCIL